ncbi:ABC transporter ATP-binding protein [Tissierella creatinophila]|uniref:Putative ABC transporter ATP-binding protein n=1 Tax=Tissierella creatinophila DSM 6911 TaxID=1123403 RepID=A0A1U7M8D9_TISCR|nr:ABC transporter ATP-binding protein [Tissierella creatinophila]OLS03582.1 putative ABC transporter ATP-binding protein [Tissierella creatinophila DSM 6911]
MLKLFKEFKPFTISLILIVALLFSQAMADLSLPDYMSNIVNVGIQQNGIENSVPEVIRKKEMETIKLFLKDDELEVLDNNYRLISKENLEEKEYKILQKKYEVLKDEPLYVLENKDKTQIEKMDNFLARSILAVNAIKSGEVPFPNLPDGVDPFTALGSLPQEQLEMIKLEIDEKFETLPEAMINQSAIVYIKDEYKAIGISIQKIQSNYIISIGGIMLLIAFLGMLAAIAVGFLSSKVASKLSRNLRDKVFTKVSSFSNSEFDNFSTASLITRSTNDIQQIQQFTVMMLRMVVYAPILGIGGVIRAIRTNASMAWIVGVGVGGILILLIAIFSVAIPRFKRIQKLVDKVNLVMRESLTGMLVIRAFNTKKYEEEKFDRANEELTNTNLFVSRIMITLMPTMNLIMNGVILLIVWVGAKEISNSNIQVGDMMAFMQYAMQIIMSFLMLSMVSVILPRASVSAGRIMDILNTEVSIKDPQNPKTIDGKTKGLIEFRNVGFKYPGAEECVIKDINFTAKPGETVAFIGSTGSGKSTIINLIPRFYDVTEGEILLDNVDIRDLSLHDLRNRIGYTPQKSTLFSGTIESNIKYGKNEDIDYKAVLEAVETSKSKEFIDGKEDGLNTEISQGGTNVSGGQKQRLSIARTIAKKPEIVIFDDSFSALDFKTDASLRLALDERLKESTILIVGQRINTIKNAQKIIVLDEGKIVGMGTHKQLLKTCDVYKQIALSQLSEEELAI